MRLLALVCFFVLWIAPDSVLAQAQSTGKIVGRITDAATKAPLGNAMVQVQGTKIGAMTTEDGRFEIRGVPVGTITLMARLLGYSPKQLPGIVVQADSTADVTITMETAATELQAQRITAAADRGTVGAAIQQQRQAPAVVNAITSEQITKSPDSDAAQAVQRVTGVTVRDGKYVFVRGLGERYTTTSLNGARIPSPEPEKRVVPLDMFPSGLLQGIMTSKTFTPDQPGDFGGASVDIKMREFPLKRVVTYSSSLGFNPSLSGKTLTASPRLGLDWLGIAGNARTLPPLAAVAAMSDTASRETVNRAIRSFRNVWAPSAERIHPNYSASASIGGTANPFGHRVGVLASATYSGSQEIRQNQSQALAVAGSEGHSIPQDQYIGHSIATGVLWGAIFNASTLVGDRTRVTFNNTYNRGADNEARELIGFKNTDNEMPSQRNSLRFIERSVRSNQISVEHMFTDRRALSVALTSSAVSRNEPDRTETEYVRDEDPSNPGQRFPFRAYTNNVEGVRKIFGKLSESNFNSTADYTHGSLKTGVAFRYTTRNSNTQVFSIMSTVFTPRALLEQPLSEILGGTATEGSENYFNVVRNAAGGTYNAEDVVGAGYAMLDQPLGERWRLVGGLRVEHADMTVKSVKITNERNTARLTNTDVLPALNVQYQVNNDQQIRFGLSQTLSRPDYREIAENDFPEWDSRQVSFGNPDLKRSLIQNYDARWEWYPSSEELISFGVFMKQHSAPIERVEVATSGAPRISFANAGGGYNYGAEIEIRKRLDMIADVLSPFTMFTNMTLMKSGINLSNNTLTAETNPKRPMVGQAPYVLNVGMNYANASGRVTGTVLYNVIGKRIYSAGTQPLPDIYELPRHILDVSLQIPLFTNVNAKLDARNLFDAPYERTQGSVTRERYTSGRVFSLGLRWQP